MVVDFPRGTQYHDPHAAGTIPRRCEIACPPIPILSIPASSARAFGSIENSLYRGAFASTVQPLAAQAISAACTLRDALELD